MNNSSDSPSPVPNIDPLIQDLKSGKVTVEQFKTVIGPHLQSPEPSGASSGRASNYVVDLARQERCGFAEVVYGEGKSVEDLMGIARTLLEAEQPVLITRIAPQHAEALADEFGIGRYQAIHNELARTFRIANRQPPSSDVQPNSLSAKPLSPSSPSPDRPLTGRVVVVTAGSCDRPVAEEAMETLAWMGVETESLADIGVAGPHRLYERRDRLGAADAIVVVAGMEGALPSVVAGYVDCPVIGVPTSVGYGAALGGFAALMSMLNSCSAHVCVVNIDAGFKAGYIAGMIAHRRQAH